MIENASCIKYTGIIRNIVEFGVHSKFSPADGRNAQYLANKIIDNDCKFKVLRKG